MSNNNIQPIDGSLTGTDLTAAINDRLRRISAGGATGPAGPQGPPGIGTSFTLNMMSGDVTLQGGPNGLTLTESGRTITIDTPQDLRTTAPPTFAGLTLRSATPGCALANPSGDTDAKLWFPTSVNGNYLISYIADDANTKSIEYMVVTRSGCTVTAIALSAETLLVEANLQPNLQLSGTTNTVSRSLAEILSESTSVRAFGVVGDGATNDAAAFQVAVNTMAANGGWLRIPAGCNIFVATASISIPSGLRLIGDGNALSKITGNGAMGGGAGLLDLDGVTDVDLIGFAIEGNVTTPVGIAYLPGWAAHHAYLVGQSIVDSNGHVQTVTTAGMSAGSAPAWNRTGGDTADGGVIWHDTGVPYATSGDPSDAQWTTGTSIWIHSGSSHIRIEDVAINHTGGYAIYWYGACSFIDIIRPRITNSRPAVMGIGTDLNYGAWNGGIFGASDGVTVAFNDINIVDAFFQNCTGNCFWTRASALPAAPLLNRNISFTAAIEDCLLDGTEPGDIDTYFEDFHARRVGFICTNGATSGFTTPGVLVDSAPTATRVPKWLDAYDPAISAWRNISAVAADTTGILLNATRRFTVDGVNGGLCSGDGMGSSTIGPCVGTSAFYSTDPLINAALCGPGGSLGTNYCSGIIPSNSNNLAAVGQGIAVVDCELNGFGYLAIGMYASRFSSVTGCVIRSPIVAGQISPITLGCIGSGPYQRAYSIKVSGCHVEWPASGGAAIAESNEYGSFQAGDANWIDDDNSFTCGALYFKDPATGTTTGKQLFATVTPGAPQLLGTFLQTEGVSASFTDHALKAYRSDGLFLAALNGAGLTLPANVAIVKGTLGVVDATNNVYGNSFSIGTVQGATVVAIDNDRNLIGQTLTINSISADGKTTTTYATISALGGIGAVSATLSGSVTAGTNVTCGSSVMNSAGGFGGVSMTLSESATVAGLVVELDGGSASGPGIQLVNKGGNGYGTVDTYTYANQTLPTTRYLAVDTGSWNGDHVFYTAQGGSPNGTLIERFRIKGNGDVNMDGNFRINSGTVISSAGQFVAAVNTTLGVNCGSLSVGGVLVVDGGRNQYAASLCIGAYGTLLTRTVVADANVALYGTSLNLISPLPPDPQDYPGAYNSTPSTTTVLDNSRNLTNINSLSIGSRLVIDSSRNQYSASISLGAQGTALTAPTVVSNQLALYGTSLTLYRSLPNNGNGGYLSTPVTTNILDTNCNLTNIATLAVTGLGSTAISCGGGITAGTGSSGGLWIGTTQVITGALALQNVSLSPTTMTVTGTGPGALTSHGSIYAEAGLISWGGAQATGFNIGDGAGNVLTYGVGTWAAPKKFGIANSGGNFYFYDTINPATLLEYIEVIGGIIVGIEN